MVDCMSISVFIVDCVNVKGWVLEVVSVIVVDCILDVCCLIVGVCAKVVRCGMLV